jgi:hypothetical protein
MMRYCFDFQSFGVSIRFMVAHEAPHFLCARLHTYPCRKGGVMETFMSDFIVVSIL